MNFILIADKCVVVVFFPSVSELNNTLLKFQALLGIEKIVVLGYLKSQDRNNNCLINTLVA